jgi:hypothetical protein
MGAVAVDDLDRADVRRGGEGLPGGGVDQTLHGRVLRVVHLQVEDQALPAGLCLLPGLW